MSGKPKSFRLAPISQSFKANNSINEYKTLGVRSNALFLAVDAIVVGLFIYNFSQKQTFVNGFSLAVGGLLLVAGLYSLKTAYRREKSLTVTKGVK